ncbi:MAG TPA: hypothetical protein DDZ51_08845 [Planctomycetaceae bacterium]|nr:hypothetical protein [Planctomycetaceae bacterium]
MRWPQEFIVLVCSLIATIALGSDEVDYHRDVKPLLQHKCTPCHGSLQQNASLRLDAGTLIHAGGESGLAVHPGKSADSPLIERIKETDSSLRMPPEGEGEPLTEQQVAILSRWIDQGAKFPDDEAIPDDPANYWSYQPITRPEMPKAYNAAWARNPIDLFVSAQHVAQSLTPRPEASPEVWLRRVYLDLIGIPPSVEERQAFLSDSEPDAYDRVVDALLHRPEYGQRWGRHWMDVWRYSDWYGSRGINEIRYGQRHLWRWRDWIVQSLVDDKPYDEMVVEMIAGDELAPAARDVLPATGYLGRNWYKFDRNVWMFDAVEHTSQAFLGLTLKCARCHDHKYDPISQQDYYRFRAFFEPHDVRTDPLSADQAKEKDATLGMVLSDGIARVFDKHLTAETYLFQRGDDRRPDKSSPLSPGVPASLGNADLTIQPVALPAEAYYPSLQESILTGLITAADTSVQVSKEQLRKAHDEVATAQQLISAFQSKVASSGDDAGGANTIFSDDFSQQSDRWKVVSGNWAWEDGKLVERSVGNFATIVGTIDLPHDFKAVVKYRTLQPGSYRSVGFSFDYIDQGNSQDVYTSANDTASSIQAFHRKDGKQEYPQAGIVKTPVEVGEVVAVEAVVRGQQLTLSLNGIVQLEYVMPVARRNGKFALWVHNGSAEFLQVNVEALVPTIDDLKRQLQSAMAEVAIAEKEVDVAVAQLDSLHASITAERAKYLDQTLDAKSTAMAAGRAERLVAIARARVAVMRESDEDKLTPLRKTLADAEAALQTPTETYSPLGDIFPATSTGRRLALARWIADPANPRTARVAVNHIWLRHFGEAIVPSVANFGLNGQSPSHPELLDWLATELVEKQWRMKPLHRMIVLSATYRQSSAVGSESESMARDPSNRYLWRMNSRRMDAEVVRDSILATAGVLDLTLGGPEIAQSQGQTTFRRSLYFRNTPNEKMLFLETFDGANPNECYRRQDSVVPHQSLAMMNSALAIDQSRRLAGRLTDKIGSGDDESARAAFISAAWQTILSREPALQEMQACQTFLEQSVASISESPPETFPASGQTATQPASESSHQRARENLVHVLYSHNDFVTIR